MAYLVELPVSESVLATGLPHCLSEGNRERGQGAGCVAACSPGGQVIVQSMALVTCPQAHWKEVS